MIRYKYLVVLIALTLSACSSSTVGSLDYQSPIYPKLQEKDVIVQSHAIIPSSCKQVSIMISKPKEEIADIITELRQSAASVGGNFVNIDTLSYMPSADSSLEKYASATIYLCEDSDG